MDTNKRHIDQVLEEKVGQNWDHLEQRSQGEEEEQEINYIDEQPELPQIQSDENSQAQIQENSPTFIHGGNHTEARSKNISQLHSQPQTQVQQNTITQNHRPLQVTQQSFPTQIQTRPGLQINTNKSIISQKSRVSSNSREVSPNRYFGSGLPGSGSIRSITPPHSSKLVNLNQNSNFYVSREQIGSIKTVQQSIIRSRVVSEVEGRPVLFLPNGVEISNEQHGKPMSTLIERKVHFHEEQAPINRNILVSNQNQHQIIHTQHPQQILQVNQNQRPTSSAQVREVRNVSSVGVEHNRQIQNEQVQNQQVRIPNQVQFHQHPQQQTQLIQNRQISNKVVVNERVHFESIVTKIVSIEQCSHKITNLTNVMLQGEKDQKKNQFIKNVLQQQNILNQRLSQLHRDINILGNQIQVHTQTQAQTQSNTNERIEQINLSQLNKIRGQYEQQIRELTELVNQRQNQSSQLEESQINSLRQEFKISLAANQELQSTIEKLKRENNDLRNKMDLLHSSDMSGGKASIQDELTKTIEGQKVMIKKLEKELINVHQERSDKSIKQENHEQILRKAQEDKLLTIIQSKKAYINELQAQIIRYKTQIKNLKQIIKEREKNDRNFSLPVIDEKTPKLDQNGRKFSADSQTHINKLQKLLSEKDNELDKVKQKIFEIQEQFDKTIEEKNDKIKQLLEQKILDDKRGIKLSSSNGEQSNQSLPSFNEQSSKPIQTIATEKQKLLVRTINSLEEQLNTKSQQNSNEIDRLNQILLQKTKEFQNLRQSLQPKQAIENENKSLRSETEVLKQTINLQIEQLQRLQNNRTQISQQQLNIIRETINKKQSQIIKLRQTIQLNLTNIQQLQNQIDAFKEQNKSIQLGLIQQKKMNSQKFSQYENKIKELESNKVSDKDKKSTETEISKLKSTIKQLKKKLKDSDHHSHQHSGQKIADSVDQQDFRQQYSPSQVKIFQLEAVVKSKENKIKQLETNLESMKVKINHTNVNEEDLISQQQIQMLKKRLTEYEAKLSYNAESLMKTYRLRDYESVHVFEQKAIYDLKAENQRLKQVLSGGKTSKISKSGKNDEVYNLGVQKRLQQFNSKLQEMIIQNKQLERTGTFPSQNTEQLFIFQRQKSVLLKKHHKQIQNLQARMVDLQRYCSALQQGPGQSTYTYTNKKQNVQFNQNSSVFVDQISYYKQKNKQLEDRVDNLIALNKELKGKLEQFLKPSGQHNLEYYRQQTVLLEQKVADVQLRISLLIQENASLKNQVSSAKSDFSIQHQLAELSDKIQSQNQTIIKLQQQKSYLQQSVQSLTKQIKTNSTDQLNHHTFLLEKQGQVSNLQQEVRKLKNQVSEFEYEITRLNNRIEIIKSQNQRLLEQIRDNDKTRKGEYESLQARFNQIQQELRQYKSKEHTWQSERFEYNQTINSLKAKLANLDENHKQETDQQNSLFQKIKQFERQLSLLQTQNYTLTQSNESLTQQIRNLQSQLQKALSSQSLNDQIINQLRYQLQYIRSVLIEVDALCSQIIIQDQIRQKGILAHMRTQIGNGLRGCQSIMV